MKNFKPMLAPNNLLNISQLKMGEYYVSSKLDGIRCIFMDGQMVSRSLKPIRNVQLHKKFNWIKEYTKKHGCIIDGELYLHEATFQEITSYVMTEDKEVPPSFGFHAFDYIDAELNQTVGYQMRRKRLFNVKAGNRQLTIHPQHKVELPKDNNLVLAMLKESYNEGYEGLILKSVHSPYKFNRATNNEGYMYKFKEYITEDAIILDVIQATQVRVGAEKKINELGNSVTSKKKADRVLIPKASAFLCKCPERFGETEFKVSIAMTDRVKEIIWANKEEYIGEKVEFKFMLEGAKDKPRHPVSLRMRWNKDDE